MRGLAKVRARPRGPIDPGSTRSPRLAHSTSPRSTEVASRGLSDPLFSPKVARGGSRGAIFVDFRSILGGFSSRLARFFANMLTSRKHRVGRVQTALRRGAHAENLANFDGNSRFCCAKRRERTRTMKKHRKLPPKSPPGCPRAAPGLPRATPGPPRGGPRGAPGTLREFLRAAKIDQSRRPEPQDPPGAIYG